MQLDDNPSVLFIAPDGSMLDNGIEQVRVIYELNLGEILIMMVLMCILSFMVIDKIVGRLWSNDK